MATAALYYVVIVVRPYHLFRITAVYLISWIIALLIAPAYIVNLTFGVQLDSAIQQLLNTIIFLTTAIAIIYWILPQTGDNKTQQLFVRYSAIFWTISSFSSALPLIVGMRELNLVDAYRISGALGISSLYLFYLWRHKSS